jgi:class 3 adenylate cyclase
LPPQVAVVRIGEETMASDRGSALRTANWVMHMGLPMLALWLLLDQPELDIAWDNQLAHFLLVLSASAVSVVLGALIGRASRTRDDTRLWLVSLVFIATAGFFGLHALFTPGVLVQTSEADFMLPTRVGMVVAGVLALASSLTTRPATAARRWWMGWPLPVLVGALMVLCTVTIVLRLPDNVPNPQVVEHAERYTALVGGALFASAALAYLPIYRRSRAVVVMSVLTAFVLLAEASVAAALGMSWHASWWLWHLLMTVAFCFIAYSAQIQFRHAGSARGLFDSLATQQTIADLRRDYAAALEDMVDTLQRRERGEPVPSGAVAARLAEKFGLSDREVAVLKRAAEAVGAERERARKLGKLVAVGRESSVIQDEDILLRRVMAAIGDAFPTDKFWLSLVRAGRLDSIDAAPDELENVAADEPSAVALPLMVKNEVAGAIAARRPDGTFCDADVALLRSFAIQSSIALENARLYNNLDGLFRSYMSPAVASALLADPEQAGLGGTTTEVTVLLADLHGFTPFAEAAPPDHVVTMLNTYYGQIVPVILDSGGTITQFLGDAVMAIWGAPVRQTDHAMRAARTGLALHDAVEESAVRANWPRFRVGISTGPALVGNIGAAQMRNFTAIGDTINLAARLQSLAKPGGVVISPDTCTALGAAARVSEHGWVKVKGKSDPIKIFVLQGLQGDHAT